MLKPFLKYLLFLCFFLLSGKGFLSAHSDLDYSSLKTAGTHASVNVETGHEEVEPIITSVSPASPHEKYEPKTVVVYEEENDNDDDEWVSLKKHLGGANYVTTLFSAQASPYFSSEQANRLFSFYQLFSYSGSPRYLAFQVFRI